MMENAASNTISSNQRSVNRNMETSVNETHNHGRILFCYINSNVYKTSSTVQTIIIFVDSARYYAVYIPIQNDSTQYNTECSHRIFYYLFAAIEACKHNALSVRY